MQTSRLLIFVSLAGFIALGTPTHGQHPTLDRARELHIAGKLRPALNGYLAFLEEAGGESPDLAAAAHNNACMVLNDLGDFARAQDNCAVAIGLRRRSGDRQPLARTLNNSALALQHLGRYDEAQAAYSEALAINEQHQNVAAQVINHSNLGLLAAAAGRYGQALAQHRRAEELAASRDSEPWSAEQIRIAWVNQGVVLEKLGAYRRALEVYQRLLPQREEMPPWQWARALINLGTVYRNLGDPVEAESSYRQAATIFRSIDDNTGLARANLNLGQVQHLNLGQPTAALRSYHDALELVASSGDRSAEVEILFLLGNLQLDTEQHDDAKETFSRCLEIAQQAGSAEGSWSAHYGLGLLALRRGELTAAAEHLTAGIQIIEETRAEVKDQGLRGGFFTERRPVYTAAIEALWQLHEHGDEPAAGRAFALARQGKERELLSAMGHQPSPTTAEDLRAVRSRLGSDVLAEYYFGQEQLFVWILTAERLTMTRIAAGQEIRRLVTQLYELLSSRQPAEARSLADLSRWLVHESGLAEALAQAPRRLWLAVDGRLRYLPFELLQLEEGSALIDHFALAYLPSASALPAASDRPEPRYSIVGLANPERPTQLDDSFSSPRLDLGPLPASAEELTRASGSLGGLANPERPTQLDDSFSPPRRNLGPLPASAEELTRASGSLGGEQRLLFGGEATPQALRQYAAEGTRVLHLAAHSVVDERPGRGAAVLLAPEGDDDGILRPREIAHLELRTDLTVLASCSSALGDADDLGALGSLTGAFLAAGSSAVLATLWDVGDQSTAIFMQQFYHQLGQGLPPAQALAEVKRRLRADPRWQAPHLWAGYVLVGDASPVVSRWRRWQPWAFGALAVVALLGAAWRFSASPENSSTSLRGVVDS